jgi:hypothetical protein
MRNVYSLYCIHSLYFSYIFRRRIHHHEGELVCLLLKTGYFYEAINYGFYIRYFVNCKRDLLELQYYTVDKTTDVAPLYCMLKTLLICSYILLTP